MALRTTDVAVKAIIEVDDTIGPLDPFIEAANSLVNRVCLTSGYDDVTLELIERWLAADFYAIRDPRIAHERAGDVQEAFMYNVGLFLAETTYGQQALALDTAGSLAQLASKNMEKGRKPITAAIVHLGCDTSRGYRYGY